MSDLSNFTSPEDRAELQKFLTMIRDFYRAADDATYFLEEKMGISNIHGIANLRDAMSHFAAFLNNEGGEKRQGHYIAAEEHVRRAIVEAYETGIDALTLKLEPLYENYMSKLLPVKDRYPSLQDAPNRLSIDATLRAIRKLEEEGRSVKTKRLWEPVWGTGTFQFVEAFQKLRELYGTMRDYWSVYEQLRLDRKNALLGWWGIVATLTTAVLGGILAYVLASR